MKPGIFLRIASVLSLLNFGLHTLGVFSPPRHGAEEIAVQDTMKLHHFDVMGSSRSYWDFLFGYGLLLSVTLLVEAILFWQLARMSKTNPAWGRPILGLFFFNCLVASILCWKYFFIGPAVTQLLIAVCLAVAFLGASQELKG